MHHSFMNQSYYYYILWWNSISYSKRTQSVFHENYMFLLRILTTAGSGTESPQLILYIDSGLLKVLLGLSTNK